MRLDDYEQLLHSPIFDSATQERINQLKDKAMADEMMDARIHDRLMPMVELLRTLGNEPRYTKRLARLVRYELHPTELQNLVRNFILPFLKVLAEPAYVDARNEGSQRLAKSIEAEVDGLLVQFGESIKEKIEDAHLPYV